MPSMNQVFRAVLGLEMKSSKPIPPSGGSGSSSWVTNREWYDGISYTSEGLDATSIVAAVVGWIVRTFPEAPIVVKKRGANGDYEKLDQHAMISLIELPNKFYSGVILLMATIADWWLDGNAYWLKIRDGQFRVVELWWVPAWMIEPKGPKDNAEPTSDNFVAYYEYRPYSGARFEIDPSDVVHFRYGLDGHNMRKGRSRFKALFREVYSDEEAARFTASLLRNMGVPGLVVSPSKETTEYTPSDDEVAATKAYIKQSFSGDKRGETLVFKGPMTVEQFGFSPDQLNMRDLRRIPEERISGVIGIAAIVAGLGAGLDRSTFANYAEAREASYEENIIPTQRIMAADIKSQLLPDFEGDSDAFRVEFDTSEVRILQEDSNKASERLIAQYRGGVATLSEVRSRLGYDIRTEFEIFALPLNADFVRADEIGDYVVNPSEPAPLPAQIVEPTVPPSLPPGAPGAEATQEPQTAARRGGTRQRSVGIHIASRASERRFLAVLERMTAKLAVKFERNLAADYAETGSAAQSAAFDLLASDDGKEIPIIILEKDDDTESTTESRGSATYQSFMAGETSADEVAGTIVASKEVKKSVADTNKKWPKDFESHYQLVGELVYEETATYLEVNMVFDATNPAELDVIRQGGKRAGLVDYSGHIRSEVKNALVEGRKRGEGPRKLARSIRDEVGDSKRALVIARTETKYAQNVSSIEAYKKSDVVTGLRAFDNQTGYNDEDCTERDGKVYSFAEAENLTAEEHPNGTLSWAPVTGSE